MFRSSDPKNNDDVPFSQFPPPWTSELIYDMSFPPGIPTPSSSKCHSAFLAFIIVSFIGINPKPYPVHLTLLTTIFIFLPYFSGFPGFDLYSFFIYTFLCYFVFGW